MTNGFVVWLTGLPSSGKTTIGEGLAARLRAQGRLVEILDGDDIRRSLSAGLGFSREDRLEHSRRITFVAKVLMRNGVDVIVPLISPYRESREYARQELARFLEVHVDCPLEECVRRDVKGLYARAISGEIDHFTGISDPYEPPERPEVVVETALFSVSYCVEKILGQAATRAYFGQGPVAAQPESIAALSQEPARRTA
jgi:adenylylsulfate kinase